MTSIKWTQKTDPKKDALKSIELLVADGDCFVSQVLKHTLGVMGFNSLQLVKHGEEALQSLKTRPFDVLITEWSMTPMDGIELVQHLRHHKGSPARTIPIIMLTGRAEKTDVKTARDAGIIEFLIKPFSPKTLYSRLELLVEQPRGFLLSPHYIGPDRRRKPINHEGRERRISLPMPILMENLSPNDDYSSPKLLPPDHALKSKITISDPLSAIITPDVLAQAQAVIAALADEALLWIKDDLKQLEKACSCLVRGDANALKPLKDSALSIKSRAGTFGYHLTSEVARLLYRFVSTDYKAKVPQHNLIIRKHIGSLVVIIASNIAGEDSDVNYVIIKELELLVSRHRDAR